MERISTYIIVIAAAIYCHHSNVSAQVPFSLQASLTNGTFIRSVITADVNNDGATDLVCVRGNPSNLYIWTNNGVGGFVSNALYSVGSFPYQVIAVDVNNDSNVDLITANNSGNSLTVLTNDGAGGFVRASTLSLGSPSAPQSVAAADFNGDGAVDLVCANSQAASFTVWTNSGAGTFTSNVTFKVGTPSSIVPKWVIAPDINGDGKPDIIGVCNNSGITYLFAWTNNGIGGFGAAPMPNISPISGLVCVTAADVNGDAKVDLILLGSQVIVLTNNGSGTFASAGTYSVGSTPYAVVAVDVNGDDWIDLITCNQGDNTLTVLTNNGSGGFGFNATLNVGSGPESMVAADVNGDGRIDLISGNWNAGSLTVLTNASTFLPRLTVKHTGSDVLLSWSANWAKWSLKQSSDLTPTSWIPFTGPISNDGFTKMATNVSPTDSRFFRLSAQ